MAIQRPLGRVVIRVSGEQGMALWSARIKMNLSAEMASSGRRYQ